MAATTRTRTPAAAPADASGLGQRIAAVEAENSALALALCAWIVRQAGPPGSMRQILVTQLGLAPGRADAIIAAAERPAP